MRRATAILAVLLLIGYAAPAAARTHVVLGFGAVFAPAPYYPAPAYYYPPPAYYYPAPAYYYPPAYYAPGPTVTPGPQRYCREYQGNATIDGSSQPFYGTACLEPDGKWHIVK
jgi:hypothetical protein